MLPTVAAFVWIAGLSGCDGGGGSASPGTFAPPLTNPPLPTLERAEASDLTGDSAPTSETAASKDSSPTTLPDDAVASEPATTETVTTERASADVIDPDAAVDIWQAAWAAAASGDVDALSRLATEDVAARWTTLVEDQIGRSLTHATFATPAPDGTVSIDECILVTPPLTGSGAARFSGVVGSTDGGVARVTDLRTDEMFNGCVPLPTFAAATAAYTDYWAVYFAIGADPNPADPRIADIAAGGHRAFLEDLFADLRDAGVVLRGQPTVHPEVSAYTSASSLTIYDCQAPDAAYGVYDVATGEITDLDLPVRPGSRDEKDVDMVLEDGRWKVSERRGQSDVACETPSGLGVDIVGDSS